MTPNQLLKTQDKSFKTNLEPLSSLFSLDTIDYNPVIGQLFNQKGIPKNFRKIFYYVSIHAKHVEKRECTYPLNHRI